MWEVVQINTNSHCTHFLSQQRNEKESSQDDVDNRLRGNEPLFVELLNRNVQQLVEDLPVHSPLCQPIVFRLSRGMSTQDASHVLGVSHMTVSRSRNHAAWGDWLVNL